MHLNAETDEFGIEMNLGNKISLVEKLDKSQTFWKMKFIKYPIDHDTEFSLNLDVKPVKIIYDATFI